MKKAVLFVVVCLAPTLGQARIITVDDDGPADFNSIQAAIDDANNGDTVEIQPGRYTGPGNRDIDFTGKAITVCSTEGPTSCIIDCQHISGHRPFAFCGGEGPTSVLRGLTLTGGKIYGGTVKGGGVYCTGSSPTIQECIITDNWVSGGIGQAARGGGICVDSSSAPTIQDCVVSHNKVTAGDGESDPMGYSGSGTSAYGGGICCYQTASVTITNCLIFKNQAVGGDGGSSMVWGSNGGDADGGGIYLAPNCESAIQNCTITANAISPGIKGDSGYARPGHDGYAYGAGVHCATDASAAIKNSIVWGDTGAAEIRGSPLITYTDIAGGYSGQGNINADPQFAAGPSGDYYLSQIASGHETDSPCIDSGDAPAESLPIAGLTTRTDEIPDAIVVDIGYHYPVSGAPLLLEVIAPNGAEHLTSSDIYEIRWFSSPLINEVRIEYSSDKGSTWTEVIPPNVGNTRRYFWTVPTMYSSNCLLRLSDAHDQNVQDISDAVFTVRPELYLFTPTYRERLFSGKVHCVKWQSKGDLSAIVVEYSIDNRLAWHVVDPPNSGDSGRYDWIVPDVNSQMCYVRLTSPEFPSLSVLSDRFMILRGNYTDRFVPLQYPTIQAAVDDCNDGDTVIVANGTYTGNGNRDISFRGKTIAVRSQCGPADCIIDCNGTASDPHRAFHFREGENPSCVLEGFTIVNGYTGSDSHEDSGGGILCENGSATIINCCLMNNTALGNGGAIACSNAWGTKVINCTVTRNHAEHHGGGLSTPGGTTLANSTFTHNYADNDGGAVFGWNSSLAVTNCLFHDNQSSQGGAIATGGNSVTISNSTFETNVAHRGGALACDDGTIQLANSILWNNQAEQGSALALTVTSSTVGSRATLAYCDVQDTSGAVYLESTTCTVDWADGNIDIDPCFVDSTARDYHLLPRSPCVDMGPRNYIPDPYMWDIDGEPRITAGRLDIGADEVGPKQADLSRDGMIDFEDFSTLIHSFNSGPADSNWYILSDLHEDNRINYSDLAVLIDDWLWQAPWHESH